MNRFRTSLLVAALLSSLAGCGSDASISCGAGTRLEGDRCVADGPTDLTRPRVERATLVHLAIEEEGQRAVYVGYPLSVALGLDLEGEAFHSEAVVGLESADASASCVLGALAIDAPERPAGAEPLQLSKELTVQPGCAALAGQTDVKAWVSFDPFDKVNVAGRAAIPAATELSPAFFAYSRLALDLCHGPDAHPDSCVTALEVKPSPGLDVSLRRFGIDSSVALVPTRFRPDRSATPGDPEAQGLEPVAAAPPAPGEGLPTVPHFHVTTDLLVYGSDASSGDKALDNDQVSLTFSLRPDPSRAPDDLPAEMRDWMPLSVERQTLKDGIKGDKVTLERLEEQFVRSLTGAAVLHKESPVFLDGASQERVLLLSDRVRHYELQVCAVAKFAEGSWEPDAAANNCASMPVVVLPQQQGSASEQPPAPTTAAGVRTVLYSNGYESSTGSNDSMKFINRVSIDVGCDTGTCKAEAGVSMRLKGEWIDKIDGDGDGDVSLLSFYAYGQSALVAQETTKAAGKIRVAGITLWDKSLNLTDGIQASLPSLEVSIPLYLIGGEGCYDGLCADIGVSIDPTLSLATAFLFKEKIAKPGCEGGRTTSNGRCFVAENFPVPWFLAEEVCKQKGGHLAEIQSAEERDAAVATMLDKKLDRAWLGAQRALQDCSPFESLVKTCLSFTCTMAQAWLNNCTAFNKAQIQSWVGNGPVTAGTFQPWAPGYFAGPGGPAGGTVQRKDGAWSELAQSYPLGFVCEYAKEFDLSATLTPSFSIPLTIEGEGYLESAKSLSIGAYGTVSALTIDFPNTIGMRFSFEGAGPDVTRPQTLGDTRLRTLLYYNAKLDLSGLDGEIGFKLAGKDIPLFQWDGITYASYNLWNYEKTRMLP